MGQGIVISSYRSEILAHLGFEAGGLSNPILDDFTLRSMWELTNNYKWREVEGESGEITLTTSTDYLDYAIPYTAITGVFLKNPDTLQWEKLIYRSRDTFITNKIDDASAEGKPEFYWQSGDTSGYPADPAGAGTLVTRLYFQPVPDQDYTINIYFERQLTNLSDSYTMSPIPREAHELILYGAVYRGFVRLRDFNSAERMKSFQDHLLSRYVPQEAKEEKDRRHARLSFTPNRPYP